MRRLFTLIFLGAVALASSQDCNDDCSCIEGFKECSDPNMTVPDAFVKYGIVKDYLPVPPKDYFVTEFKTSTINLGTFVSPLRAIDPMHVDYPNKKPDTLYTLAFIGVDPNLSQADFMGYINYLVMNLPSDDIPSYSLHKEIVVPFTPASPSLDKGLHRSMALLYEQKEKIDTTQLDLIKLAQTRAIPKIAEWAKKYDLGDPVAGNFFVTELRQCGNK